MNNPFDFFDRIHCVNLPRSVERKNRVSLEFQKMDILERVTWVWAKAPSQDFVTRNIRKPGIIGCVLSHMKAITLALEKNARNCLILEDDVIFEEDSKERLEQGLKQLPEDWTILYFGGSPQENMTGYSSQLSYSERMHGTIGYALNRKSMYSVLNKYFDELTLEFPRNCADNILGDYAKNNKGMTFDPYLCLTSDGISEVQQGYRNYNSYVKSLWNLRRGVK